MSGMFDNKIAIVQVEGETELGAMDDRAVEAQLPELDHEMTVRHGGKMIDSNTHVTYLDPEELGEKEECLGVPRLVAVALRDAVVAGPLPLQGHADPRHDDGDQVAGLAAEHTRGQPQVVHAEVNVPELELGLEQLQPPPDGAEPELGVVEEQRHDPGQEPGQQPVGQEPGGDEKHEEPGQQHPDRCKLT